MKVVIISGGQIEDGFAREWLKENPYDMLIAADSGVDFLYRNQIVPDLIVGDFDSAKTEVTEGLFGTDTCEAEVIRLNPMKDDTDTEFAVREAARRRATEITILGGTGSRLDHVLGNMHLLGIGLSEKQISITLVDSHNRIRMLGVGQSLRIAKEEQFGKYVSVLPFTGTASGVNMEGFAYELSDATLHPFCSLGVSNEIAGDAGVISVREGTLLIVESRD